MINEPCLWSAHEQARAIRAGELKSRELLERYIERIESIDQKLNAVVTRDFESARRAADTADKAVATGGQLGILHGLPATIKDAIETKGLRSTGGAIELTDHIPSEDAPVVQAVKSAGAYVFGKTNLPRFSADLQANNEIFGRTNNPWNLEYGPGGSSGGAAAAVAAGLTSFDIGTDVGGSIRFPASFCGVFGHKPSFGIVPATGYLDSANSLRPEIDSNVIGPIARSAEDLDMLLSAITSKKRPLVADLDEPVVDAKKLRVAAWLDDAAASVNAEVLEVLTKAVDALESEARIVTDRSARPDFDLHWASELTKMLLLSAHAGTEDELKHHEWLEMNRERLKLRNAWSTFFERYDIVLMPVCVVPPFEHLDEDTKTGKPLVVNGEKKDYFEALRWTTPVGQAYLPSTVAPIGLGKSGLPIGIQVVGRFGADRNTIRFAGLVSSVCDGYQHPPIAIV